MDVHAPALFISYSHQDKRVARRVQRRWDAHGFKAWLDERQLRPGTTLSPAIRQHLQACDLVLVIASQASADSKWVGLELGFARELGKPMIPLFIDPVSTHEYFREHMGVDATSPQEFASALQQLMVDLLARVEQPLPAPQPERLEAGLRQLAQQEPEVAPLIIGCLDGEGLHYACLGTVFGAPFHAVDEAVETLAELQPGERIAEHLAVCFVGAGAGAHGLLKWISATGDGGLALVSAVGEPLKPAYLPTALKLLQACNPPNNHALCKFVHCNVERLDAPQRAATLRLVTWPVREDIGNMAVALAWVASKHFPEAPEIQYMWMHWIRKGAFDQDPTLLARKLAEAQQEQLPGWAPIVKELRNYVHGGLHSGDKQKVVSACDYIQAAADEEATDALHELLGETEGVSGTYEWKEWRKQDADTAEWAGWYVFHVADQARGERDWQWPWIAANERAALGRMRHKAVGDGAA